MPWRLPDCWYRTFPVPVILKRFFAPDLVFSLGIWLSFERIGVPSNAHGRSRERETPRSKRGRGCRLSLFPSPRQPFGRATERRVMAERVAKDNRPRRGIRCGRGKSCQDGVAVTAAPEPSPFAALQNGRL